MAKKNGLVDFSLKSGAKGKSKGSTIKAQKKSAAVGTKLVSYRRFGWIRQSKDYVSPGSPTAINKPTKVYLKRYLHTFDVHFAAEFKSIPQLEVRIVGLHHDQDHNTYYDIWYDKLTPTGFVCNVLLSTSTLGVKIEAKALGYAYDRSYTIAGPPNFEGVTVLE